MTSQNNLPEVHGEFLSKRVQMWNRPDTNVELLDLNVQFRIGIEVGFVYFTKEMCVCLKVRWWVWAGRYFSKRGLFAHRALLYTLVPRSAQWKKIGKINVMKILSKGMLLLSQLFQNPGSSILPIFSTHSYFNNIAKNISCFMKILHTCLDVYHSTIS